jgi:hypothetical protein
MSEIEIYEQTWKLANRVHQTPFVPRAMQGKPEHVLACVLYGNELGLGPMQALNSIHVIEGRAAASPELMRALVNKAGHRIDVLENTNDVCVMKGTRHDTGAEATVRWSINDAKNANLTGKDNWKKYPRAMLTARATSELCRLLFPDVIAGLSYTAEEVESFDDIRTKTAERGTNAPVVAEIIHDAAIVEDDAVPHAAPSEPEVPTGASMPSGSDTEPDVDPIALVFEAFPETTIIEDDVVEAELLPTNGTLEDRRRQMKGWGNWNRVRAIATPFARAEGKQVPQSIDEFIADDQLFQAVANTIGGGK